jgi:tetratricopeptide (TPR) repeat protein
MHNKASKSISFRNREATIFIVLAIIGISVVIFLADSRPKPEFPKFVNALLEQANTELADGKYSGAIMLAEEVRVLKLRGHVEFRKKATQIIRQARRAQETIFEPQHRKALDLYEDGKFVDSRTICLELLKRDPFYQKAKNLMRLNQREMTEIAEKEYITATLLEDRGEKTEAQKHWDKAKKYVWPGDKYYRLVIRDKASPAKQYK